MSGATAARVGFFLPADNPETPMREVQAAGIRVLTADPVMLAVMRRLAELESENTALRHELTARYRTLRRDVSRIVRAVTSAKAI